MKVLGALLWLFFKKVFEQKTAALVASYDRTAPAELVARDTHTFVATPTRLGAPEGPPTPRGAASARVVAAPHAFLALSFSPHGAAS
jgi:hypothetical protein